MVEVTLIAPTAQVQTVGAGGQQAQNATQTGQLATPHLSPGALVAGIITGNDGGGGYLLKTDVGTLTLHSSVPLTYNSDVLIRVDNSNGSNAAARIITVNGEAFASYSAPVQTEGDSVSPVLLAKADAQASTQTTTVTADATPLPAKFIAIAAATVPTPVTSGTSAPAVLPSLEATVPAGTNVTLYIAEPSANTASTAPATPSPSAFSATNTQPAENPSSPLSSQTTAAPDHAATTTATATTTQVTSNVDNKTAMTPQPLTAAPTMPDTVARLIVPQPPSLNESSQSGSFFVPEPQAQATPTQSPTVQTTQYAAYAKSTPLSPAPATTTATASPTPPELIESEVAIQHPDGTITLSTPRGQLTVQPENLPAHALLQIGTPVTLALPPQMLATAQEATSTSKFLWEPLIQILNVLQDKMPAAANDVLSRFPTIGENFLSSSMFFLSTLLQGNAKKLLGGTAMEVLKDTGTDDLADSFTAHVRMAAQAFTSATEPTAVQHWQGMVMPLVYQGEIQEARIYVKREPPRKDKEQKKSSADTRFIIEVDFSDLGALQLDGLVLPKLSNTVFDLIVRTHTAFAAEDRTELMQIYNNAAELTGFKGSISFQVSRQFPVNPLAEMAASPLRDIIA